MNSHDDRDDPNPPAARDAHPDARDAHPDAADAPDALEAELLALGALLDVPAAPPATDIAAAVRTRLTQPDPGLPDPGRPDPGRPAAPDPGLPDPDLVADPPEPARGARTGPSRRGTRARRRRWAVVVAVVAAVVAVTAATPQGRAAVVKILRFAGVELRVSDTPPPPLTTTAPLPGERAVPPEDLPSLARFPVRTPARLGPPQAATVSDGGRVASMFWPGGIRLDQFDGEMEPYFFKQLGPPFPAHFELGGGTDGWWIAGEHPLGHLRRVDGTVVPLRQAAPTLIWTSGGVNHRLEGVRTAGEAVEIARSLR
ncbi:hypothetical protein Nocox_04110 [Nonomuraea coxensis DSM 45129]|uniref:DUF4367 domain-containing protein n=1 Tax=Nonomuraea coxensis DSM 45129 TaxID=1122611 RepID=A0ABX8TSK1_9ACTN|nr:hypothetical protein [Nonomuraea coxensis]QYC38450.1 hypothetical protein Nocox_04110 [Nonomuraea coxensis DSM 45129]